MVSTGRKATMSMMCLCTLQTGSCCFVYLQNRQTSHSLTVPLAPGSIWVNSFECVLVRESRHCLITSTPVALYGLVCTLHSVSIECFFYCHRHQPSHEKAADSASFSVAVIAHSKVTLCLFYQSFLLFFSVSGCFQLVSFLANNNRLAIT